MSLLTALLHRGNDPYIPPKEEPMGDLVVDSVVIVKDGMQREISDHLRRAFKLENMRIESDRDKWKAKADHADQFAGDISALKSEILELRLEIQKLLEKMA